MSIPPEAAELANEANSVFVDEDYDTALDLYSQVRRRRAARRASPPGAYRVVQSAGRGGRVHATGDGERLQVNAAICCAGSCSRTGMRRPVRGAGPGASEER